MQVIELHRGHPSDYLRDVLDYERILHFKKRHPGMSELEALMLLAKYPPIAGGSGTLSNYAETKILDHANGKTSWTMPTTIALALCTTLPDSSKTGSTIVEANYTGYGRQTIAGAGWNAASAGGAGAASTTSNNGAITYANCTSGSSVVVGWAICDSATTAAGNMIWWGSCTSTTISTTQTPATVGNGALQEQLT